MSSLQALTPIRTSSPSPISKMVAMAGTRGGLPLPSRGDAPNEPDHQPRLCHPRPLMKSLLIQGLITPILIPRQLEGSNRQADALRGHKIEDLQQ